MARLIVKNERATRPGRTYPLGFFPRTPEHLRDGQLPDDGIERTTRNERMWWRRDNSLAAGPGMPFPVADLPLLMGDDEHKAKMRGLSWPPKAVKP